MQILSNNAVATGVGVYWMFYSGASFEDVEAPEGFPGLQAHDSIEGLRYAPDRNRILKRARKIRQRTFTTPSSPPSPGPKALFPLSLCLDSPLQTFCGTGELASSRVPECSGMSCSLRGLSYGSATTAAFCLNNHKRTIAAIAVPVTTAFGAGRIQCT